MAILIKSGLVCDGTGSAPEKKDVLIRDNYIAKIGTLSRSHGDEVIDATGAIITPGCIDVTTHSDHHHSIFYEPLQEDFIRQGVTTIIGGNCGVSLAPLLGSTLEVSWEWGNTNKTNANWRTMKEFFTEFQSRKFGVNFGTLAGHTSLRTGITKNIFRDLTDSELSLLIEEVRRALKDGAFGISLGLEHIHGKRVPYYELKKIAQMVAEKNRVLAIHLRSQDDTFTEALDEVISLAKETNVNMHISHLKPLKKYAKQYTEALETITDATRDAYIHFDTNTFETVPLLAYELLPEWMHEESFSKFKEGISHSIQKNRIIEYLKKNAAKDYIVSHVPDPSQKFLEGKSLKEFAKLRNISYEEGILEFLRVTGLRATLSAKLGDPALIEQYIAHPNAVISSNSAAFGKKEFKQKQGIATFSDFFSSVSRTKNIPIEKAVEKCTGIPARTYGIERRGILKEGNFADVVLWYNEEPYRVFINGYAALTDKKINPTPYGKLLQKKEVKT